MSRTLRILTVGALLTGLTPTAAAETGVACAGTSPVGTVGVRIEPHAAWIAVPTGTIDFVRRCGEGALQKAEADLFEAALLIFDLHTAQWMALTGQDWTRDGRPLAPLMQDAQVYGFPHALSQLPRGFVAAVTEAIRDIASGRPERIGAGGWTVATSFAGGAGAFKVVRSFRVVPGIGATGSVGGAAAATMVPALEADLAGATAGAGVAGGVLVVHYAAGDGSGSPLRGLRPGEARQVREFAERVRANRGEPLPPEFVRAAEAELKAARKVARDPKLTPGERLKRLDDIQKVLSERYGASRPGSPFFGGYRRLMGDRVRLRVEVLDQRVTARVAENGGRSLGDATYWGRQVRRMRSRINEEFGLATREAQRLHRVLDRVYRLSHYGE